MVKIWLGSVLVDHEVAGRKRTRAQLYKLLFNNVVLWLPLLVYYKFHLAPLIVYGKVLFPECPESNESPLPVRGRALKIPLRGRDKGVGKSAL